MTLGSQIQQDPTRVAPRRLPHPLALFLPPLFLIWLTAKALAFPHPPTPLPSMALFLFPWFHAALAGAGETGVLLGFSFTVLAVAESGTKMP